MVYQWEAVDMVEGMRCLIRAPVPGGWFVLPSPTVMNMGAPYAPLLPDLPMKPLAYGGLTFVEDDQHSWAPVVHPGKVSIGARTGA